MGWHDVMMMTTTITKHIRQTLSVSVLVDPVTVYGRCFVSICCLEFVFEFDICKDTSPSRGRNDGHCL